MFQTVNDTKSWMDGVEDFKILGDFMFAMKATNDVNINITIWLCIMPFVFLFF